MGLVLKKVPIPGFYHGLVAERHNSLIIKDGVTLAEAKLNLQLS